MNVKRFDSSEGNLWKYVFDFGDAIAEAVLYRYDSFNKRTVLCISVQSGCGQLWYVQEWLKNHKK